MRALFLLLLVGCADPPPPIAPVAATAVGYRALLGDGLGPGLPLYGAEHRPVIRVAATEAGPWTVVGVGASARTLPHTEEVRGEGRLLRVQPGALPEGVGALILQRGGAAVWVQPAAWTWDLAAIDASVAEAREAPAGERVAAWMQAAARARKAGVPSEISRAWRVAGFYALLDRDFLKTSNLIAQAHALDVSIGYVFGLVLDDKFAGQVAQETGDHVTALRLLAAAVERAERSGIDALLPTLRMELSAAHANLGALAEALRVVRTSTPPKGDHARANYSANLGWVEMLAMEVGVLPRDFSKVKARFDLAERLYRQAGQSEAAASAALNRANAQLLAGEPAAAVQTLKRIGEVGERALPHARLIEGRAHLALGHLGAAADAFERAGEELAGGPVGSGADLGWRRLFGLGRVARLRGDAERALDRFRAAVSELEAASLGTAIMDGRTPFFAARGAVYAHTLELLIEQEAWSEAFTMADAARAHVLRTLDAQARLMRLAPEAQAGRQVRLKEWFEARAEYEAGRRQRDLLAAAEIEGWERARRRARSRLTSRLEAAFGENARAALLAVPRADPASVATGLEVGERLAVRLGDSPAQAWLVLDADGVVQAAPLPSSGYTHLYVVDLRPEETGAGSVSHLPFAAALLRRGGSTGPPLVIADPRVDLRGARAEGLLVASKLPGARLLEGRAATREAVLSALPEAGVFHFAGHGALEPHSPWDAHLQLADGARLTLADVLALPAAPRLIVLSGCETGRRGDLGGERVGLPDAFLLAGAQSVVATRRVVDDTRAAAFVAEFYAQGGADRPGPALLAARAILAARGDDVGDAFYLTGRP